MRAVDTNALVRLVVCDDPSQQATAEEFIAAGACVSHLVLAETIWVLEAVFERGPAELAPAIEMLLDHKHLALQEPDVVNAALEQFRKRPALGFTDCLVVEIARKAGHLPLGTFDRNLAKIDGVRRL